MLKQIKKEKDEEMVRVDMWSHFGHVYITKVDEGERDRAGKAGRTSFVSKKKVTSFILSKPGKEGLLWDSREQKVYQFFE